MMQQLQADESESLIEHGSVIEKSSISEMFSSASPAYQDYHKNLFKMCIIWSATSFIYYLMQISDKYLEGSITTNFFYDCLADILSVAFTILLYEKYSVRNSLAICYTGSMLSGILIMLFEQKVVSLSSLEQIATDSAQSSSSSDTQKDQLTHIIPILAFLLKLGNNSTFNVAYVASFSNDAYFPMTQRATAIGICNFVARSLTCLSFFVAEQEKPTPMLCMLGLAVVALVTSLTLPTKQEEEDTLRAIKALEGGRHPPKR